MLVLAPLAVELHAAGDAVCAPRRQGSSKSYPVRCSFKGSPRFATAKQTTLMEIRDQKRADESPHESVDRL